MKGRLAVCAFLALLFVTKSGCVQVFESNKENVTSTVEPLKESDYLNASLSSQAIASDSANDEKARIINGDDSYHVTSSTTSTTTTTTHRIPPTLLNTKLEFNRETSDKPVKSLKDLA